MALIYYDHKVEKEAAKCHPAITLDKTHPCFRIVREGIDGKSVIHWDAEQAYAMYNWYVKNWNSTDIRTEFGEKVYDSTFSEIIQKSYYLIDSCIPDGAPILSDITIEELWDMRENEASQDMEEEESDGISIHEEGE